MGWHIPDWASVLGFLWAVAASGFGAWKTFTKHQSESFSHRFLVGLKASATPAQLAQINDELERIKPSKRKRHA